MKFGLNNTVITRVCKVFQNYIEVERAIIFGSRAKNNFKHNSDIDIALIGSSLTPSIKYKIENDLDDLLLPYKIDLVLYDKLSDTNLKNEILKYGISFYDKTRK